MFEMLQQESQYWAPMHQVMHGRDWDSSYGGLGETKADFTGSTASWTDGGVFIYNTTTTAAAMYWSHNDFEGNIRLDFDASAAGSSGTGQMWSGFFPVADAGSFDQNSSTGGVFNNASVESVALYQTSRADVNNSNNLLYSSNTNDVTANISNAILRSIRRVGSVWTYWEDGVLHTTLSSTEAGPMRFAMANANSQAASLSRLIRPFFQN